MSSPSKVHATHHHGHHHDHDARTVKCAVITVSDTRTIADDSSGAAIVELLREGGLDPALRLLVRDDRAAIGEAIEQAIGAHARLIVTTGGTGIAPRDVTIEVVEALVEKRLDGFGEAFRRLSWDQVGPRSLLSRALAGTRKNVLICALPGSERAVRLAVKELVVPIATHALGLLEG